jgi:eukaryotic-like serine/threonine-protein kinase
MARFQREARILASLQHPNIASIYGIEEDGGKVGLVMELVEGEDLSERLGRGPVPVDEAIAIAIQIAEGLEEAHERGIVHRDLKPANIKLMPDGRVKILDFGLARAFAGEAAAEGDLSNSPTITAMTQRGMILGTAAYMSPEQARGKPVDRRADIWAFGLIIFEMLTGKKVFAGETVSDTLAGVLVKDLDWSLLPADLPLRVQRVLRRCLERDPRQRLRDIGEARIRLSDPHGMSTDDPETTPPAVRRPARWLQLLPWGLLAAGCLALAVGLTGGWFGQDRDDLIHLTFPIPDGHDFKLEATSPAVPVVSPDGTRIVFGARRSDDASSRLYVRSLAAGRAHALDGTEGAQFPFWSPDGRWIGFFVLGEGLKKIPAGGGPAQFICEADNGKGATWNDDGLILFSPSHNTPIHRVSAAGGSPSPVTSLAEDEGVDSHRHPRFLPGGRSFLYLARRSGAGGTSQLRLADLDGQQTDVIQTTHGVEYAAGHLFFLRDRTLFAQPFDVRSGRLTGEVSAVAQDVVALPAGVAAAAFSVSSNGVLTYLAGEGRSLASLQWRDRRGAALDQLGDEAIYETVVLSPDDRWAVVTMRSSPNSYLDLWVYEIERNLRTRFTFAEYDDQYPIWEPDGRALLFYSFRGSEHGIYRKELGGTGEVTRVLADDEMIIPGSISPDKRWLTFMKSDPDNDWDLWLADLSGEEEPHVLRRTPFADGAARISPDGRWIIFWSTESGRGQVYLAPFPALAPIRQVSTTSGTWSGWRGDGQEIFYQEQNGRLMAVSVVLDDAGARIGTPAALFDHSGVTFDGPRISHARDGERFLSIESTMTNIPTHCEVVVGWPRLLERR